ncbi:peroxidase-like [Ctenocephalides felis]|uniref:peroxidase-like n=1 Tax=Ctenocephalides felis TaxID=7515 RepID=UPI000E6E20DF|nr:peroxidase-like [Ctenocephalides felis]
MDPLWTLANMQWGQIVTHDMSLLAGSTQSKPHATRCCTDDGKLIERTRAHTTCLAIVIPHDDPVYRHTNRECMNFVRTITDRDRGCQTHPAYPAEQLTVVTAYMDLSLVYGNTKQQNDMLRAWVGGRMATDVRGGREWPPAAPNATASCDIQQPGEVCYLAGDVRVNQNTQLTILQIILLREHNRIADALAHMNPHWDDERVFQEARHINIAQAQHINYYEWLPIMLGVDNMVKNHLIYQQPYTFIDDYDPEVDPSVLNEHATAAFRYFHTQIAGRLDLVSEHRNSFGGLRLSDWFNRPVIIEQANNMDDLTRGLATQPQALTDQKFDPEIKHYLFRGASPFGNDLRAIDIQRNRDHGLGSYNDYREFCGLKRAHTFEEFHTHENAISMERLYESPDDVDLTVGGSLEAHVPGAIAGPTFLCILTEQFFRTRVGDRFFFEGPHTGFSQGQLNEIRKSSISRLFCDNGDNVRTIQPQGFNRVSNLNPLLPCENIPFVDLSLWKEY